MNSLFEIISRRGPSRCVYCFKGRFFSVRAKYSWENVVGDKGCIVRNENEVIPKRPAYEQALRESKKRGICAHVRGLMNTGGFPKWQRVPLGSMHLEFTVVRRIVESSRVGGGFTAAQSTGVCYPSPCGVSTPGWNTSLSPIRPFRFYP